MSGRRDPYARGEARDHLQARRPFTYNLATGLLIGAVLVLFGLSWVGAVAYVLIWAGLRWWLWRPGRLLRRQYEARLERVAEARAGDPGDDGATGGS